MVCFKWPTKFCTTSHGGYDDLPATGMGIFSTCSVGLRRQRAIGEGGRREAGGGFSTPSAGSCRRTQLNDPHYVL